MSSQSSVVEWMDVRNEPSEDVTADPSPLHVMTHDSRRVDACALSNEVKATEMFPEMSFVAKNATTNISDCYHFLVVDLSLLFVRVAREE